MLKLTDFFKDCDHRLSASRLVAILGSITLMIALLLSMFIDPTITVGIATVLGTAITAQYGVGKWQDSQTESIEDVVEPTDK